MTLEMPENYDENSAPECLGIEQAIKRFESVLLARIYVQQRLANRLKNSIRIGMASLFFIAVSISILLLTLSTQIKQAREAVGHMNENFVVISENMMMINQYMTDMEKQVSYLPAINHVTSDMNQKMVSLNENFAIIRQEISETNGSVNQLQGKMERVAGSVQHIDGQVNFLNRDTSRISKPAKRMKNFFPF